MWTPARLQPPLFTASTSADGPLRLAGVLLVLSGVIGLVPCACEVVYVSVEGPACGPANLCCAIT